MRVSNRCYAVTGLGYSPPWCVNAGFVVGDNLTLVVDTGGNTLAAQSIYGYASAVRTGNQLRVINTEKHFDHIGGNSFFLEHDIEIWGHAGIARTAGEFEAEIAEFNTAIPNAARRERGEAAAFFYETRLANPNRRIREDANVDLGGCTVEILLTPGHTPTNLSVWVPDDGVLFTGDCLIREYLPNLDAGTRADWQVWLESLARIEARKPQSWLRVTDRFREAKRSRRFWRTCGASSGKPSNGAIRRLRIASEVAGALTPSPAPAPDPR